MCTGIRFVDDNGNMYFGRNLDWSCSYGEKAVIAPTSYALVPIDGKTNIAAYEFPLWVVARASCRRAAHVGIVRRYCQQSAPVRIPLLYFPPGMCNSVAQEERGWQ